MSAVGPRSAVAADGARWAVAAPDPRAAEAAARAFEAGGTAVDAALHAATTLAVVYPHQCGAGGDLFALVQNPDGKVVAIDASGRAPSRADPDAVRRAHGEIVPSRGPASVTIPGAVRGWEALHTQGASLPWASAFEAPVAAALDGFDVSRDLSIALANVAEELGADPVFAETFLRDGPPAEGTRITQPALGAALGVIAERGADGLYRGPLAARLAEGLREAGVPLEPHDLERQTAELVPPIRGRYRDLDVLVAPPPSQGFVLLESLEAVERLGTDPDPLGAGAGTLALIAAAAATDRDRHLADPDAMELHVSALLDDGHLAALADAVRAGVPGRGHGRPGGTGDGDTVAVMTADADGWAVSLLQSLYDTFGSGIVEPATGLVLHDRAACFSLSRGHPNELAPGKRPAHTLLPVAVQRDGRLVAVTGTRGGHGQPQIDLQTIVRCFDLGLVPADVLTAPRWLVGGMEPLDRDPWVVAEADVPDRAIDAIAAAGFRIDRVAERDRALGHAMLVRIDGDGLHAASDPRSDVGALAS
jgi:gamma-glutamyltranspeptidase